MKQVNLVDGTYDIYRAMFAAGNLISTKGEYTGGVYKFLRMLYQHRDRGDQVAVFDHSHAKFRMDILPTYKVKQPGGYEKTQEEKEKDHNFTFTLNCLMSLLPRMGIPAMRMEGTEADDVLYRLAGYHMQVGNRVRVLSDDSDYLQFINLGVELYRPRKRVTITIDNFQELMGFESMYFTLHKSMTGDSSDAIPGVRGIGAKTATKIVNEISQPSIEEIIKWGNSGTKSMHRKITEGISIIKRNMLLIDLEFIPLTIEEVGEDYERSVSKAKIDIEYVKQVFSRLEFASLDNWIDLLKERSK